MEINLNYNGNYYYGDNFKSPKLKYLSISKLEQILYSFKDYYKLSEKAFIPNLGYFNGSEDLNYDFHELFDLEERDKNSEEYIKVLLKTISVVLNSNSYYEDGYFMQYLKTFSPLLTFTELVELFNHLAYPYTDEEYMWYGFSEISLNELPNEVLVKWVVMGGDGDSYINGAEHIKIATSKDIKSFDEVQTVKELIEVLKTFPEESKIEFQITKIGE